MTVASLIGAFGYLFVFFPFLRLGNLITSLYSLLLRIPDDNQVRYFATFCITSGTYTTIGLTIAWCAFLYLLDGILDSRPE